MDRADALLAEVSRAYREHPGLRGKSALALVGEVLGGPDPVRGPGDDAAALPDGDGFLLLAGEAIWPPFVEGDPRGAGVAAVVANANDVAAMGGRPLALVDAVVAPPAHARRILEGIREAADLYRIPVVGGHLTARGGPPALSAFVLGRARALLPATAVRPGQAVLFAGCLEGRLIPGIPAFTSVAQRGAELREDLELLPRLAEEGRVAAAKDVSMAGLLGSLAMLLEPTGAGAVVLLDRVPTPRDVPAPTWVVTFPTFGFLLTAEPGQVSAVRRAFRDRGLACERIGDTDESGRLRVRLGDGEVDLGPVRGVTGLAGEP
ncbi:MAG TPA: AIR synthase related protein [Actinomycetota bacterium]|nr:AIR synthase related protein [Actinomycetota bacterium]